MAYYSLYIHWSNSFSHHSQYIYVPSVATMRVLCRTAAPLSIFAYDWEQEKMAYLFYCSSFLIFGNNTSSNAIQEIPQVHSWNQWSTTSIMGSKQQLQTYHFYTTIPRTRGEVPSNLIKATIDISQTPKWMWTTKIVLRSTCKLFTVKRC